MKECKIEEGIDVVRGDEVAEDCTRIVFPPSVREIDGFAFFANETIEELVFSEGLEEIGDCAFRECTALREVVLPSSLKKLDDSAFMGCTSLRRVVFLGEGPKEIATEAFYGCKALTEVRFGTALKELSAGMMNGGSFGECVSLEEVVLPEGLEHLGCGTFEGCTKLSRINFPPLLNGLGEESLSGTAITEIVLPEGALTFWKAVNHCDKLRRIVLPSTVTSLSYKVFGALPALTEVVLPKRFEADRMLFFCEEDLGRIRITYI